MPEAVFPRPISLANYTAFQASHAYSLGTIVKPTTPNNHIYQVTTAGTSSTEPSWPTTAQGTVVSGTVTFTEHGIAGQIEFVAKYLKRPKDWEAITVTSEFEDSGRDFLIRAPTPVQFYELSFEGLIDTEASILDAFWDTHGMHLPFTLVEPRDHPWTGVEGLTVNGCRFTVFERDHDKVKNTQSRKIVIAKFPE